MVRSRTATAAVGLLAGLAVSAVVWYYTNSLVLFLFVPFVPLVLRGTSGRERRDEGSRARGDQVEQREQPPLRRCRACGFETRDPEFEYCPRDGRRLR